MQRSVFPNLITMSCSVPVYPVIESKGAVGISVAITTSMLQVVPVVWIGHICPVTDLTNANGVYSSCLVIILQH